MKTLSKALKGILGKRIEKLDQSNDYVNVKFVGGGDLTIYYAVTMINPKKAGPEVVVGSCITKIIEDLEHVEIYFDNESALNVSLRFDFSRGVESMQLVMPGEPIVVWN